MSEPTESSPLLEAGAEETTQNGSPLPETEPSPIPAREHFKRPIKIITTLIIYASITDLALIIATHLVAQYGPFDPGSGSFFRSGLEALGFFIAFALIVSIVNVRSQVHIILNAILDIVLAYSILYTTGDLLGDTWPDYGFCGVPGYRKMKYPQCPRWKIALQALTGIVNGFSALVGILVLVLFVARVLAMLRTRFWQRPWGLYFPTGELTVAFTIKVLKQQPPVENQTPAGPGVQVTVE